MLRVARRPGGCRASITGACSASALDLSPLALDAPIPVVLAHTCAAHVCAFKNELKLKDHFSFLHVLPLHVFNVIFLFYHQCFFICFVIFLFVRI